MIRAAAVLACVIAGSVLPDAAGRVLAHAQKTLTLELRIFDGLEEVTSQTRIKLHRAGERTEVVAQTNPGQPGVELTVGEGIYDAQAIREKGEEVVSIRWANRLVVMPYPDEGGHHLEVVNFKSGFGALQIRSPDGERPDVAIYHAGSRNKEVAPPIAGRTYTLFVVPAGKYDVFVKGTRSAWHAGIDVPLDRTRLWLVPDRQ
jgi:hypothetical protein